MKNDQYISASKIPAAKEVVNYFQKLVDDKGDQWLLGLFMAKQWLRLLESGHYDPDEVSLFIRTLEAERLRQGSGWSDLYIRVKRWAAEIESLRLN
jgi:hypothetical protein